MSLSVGIIGAGQWGRALATLVAEAGHQPRFGYRGRPAPGFPGSPNLPAVVAESDLVLYATPPEELKEAILASRPGPGSRVLIATRGLEPESGGWLSQLVLSQSACLRVGAVAGPALAAEVLARRPSALVVASAYDEVARLGQAALHSPICRVYTSGDLRGVELAGAMVQVLAAVIGMVDQLQLGVGAQSIVVTRGLAEATRLGMALHADSATFAGLAGVGDLVATGNHPEHPTRAIGARLAREGGQDAALVAHARALLRLSIRHKVELPITTAVAAIAEGRMKPMLAMDALMRRGARAEATLSSARG
jgi:glycerol-3-phosphate dehydrogenase (NAD(P)+)